MTENKILHTVHTLFEPGDVIEIRLKKGGKLYSGYYDYAHFEKLADDVKKYDILAGTEAIYYTVNPVQDVLLARCNNRIEKADITTSDDHIKYRKYLPIDIDPIRPTKTSSTDIQHNQSIELAHDVAKKMTDIYGWPEPIIGDSGNGAHLLYRIDEPNTPESKDLVDAALTGIIEANKTDNGIKIEKWANAGRIWKLYGTMNRKGDSLPEMNIHHRRSKLLQVPDDVQTVTTEQLQAMAGTSTTEKEAQPAKSKPKKIKGIFDVKGWMDKHNIKVVRTKNDPGLTVYVLESCPINSDHTGNREAVIMQEDGGKLAFKCHHDSCKDKHWSDVREKYEPGYKVKAEKTNNLPLFMDGKQFIPKVLGDDILSQYSIVTFPDSLDVAIFKDGVFNIAKGAQLLQEIITDKLGEDFQKNRLHEVITYIQISTYTSREEMNTHTHLINVRNGMYDVQEDKLLPHDPKYKSTIQLNVVHDVKAECPAICKFLSEVTTNEGQAKVIQYAGYSCTPDIKFQKTLLIDGPQQNGKSTFLEMVCHMIGQENTSQQSLQSLNDDRFARERLNNKLVNFYGDLPARKLHDNSVFKMLTSDQYIDGEKKYGQKFRYKNTIHQMYALNKVPELSDPDEMAFFRRLICVSFPTSFEGKADRDLSNKITTESEISGFFNLAMTGLRILIEMDEFAYNKSVEDIQKEYLNKSNPVATFLEECTEYSNEEIGKKGLYETFKEWCKKCNVTTTPDINQFSVHMKKMGYEDYRTGKAPREYRWCNINYITEGVDIRPSNEKGLDAYNQQQEAQTSERPTKNHILSYANTKDILYSGYVEENVHFSRSVGRIGPKTQTEDTTEGVQRSTKPSDASDASQRDKVKAVKDIIMSLKDKNGIRVNHEDIKSQAEQEGITDTDTIMLHLVKDGLICDTGDKLYMVV